ncbi:hypothetical protein B0H14DRAFT_3174358 [Mycena olivaceomarginata]|nr:hypothetical protein B0H14DRAFT_3174358 [Mycena olivaceomarginata]
MNMNIATAIHPKCKEDVEAQAATATDDEGEEWQHRDHAPPPPPSPRPRAPPSASSALLELENEQRLEDAEALKFTDEQRLSLFLSFRSVKFEWSDLDGMRSVRGATIPLSPPRRPRRSLLARRTSTRRC